MQADELFESIKENLNGRPGQPIVLGVCKTLAEKFGREPWIFRAVAIVLAVFYTGLALVAYVLLGLFMAETGERTRGIFQGLFIWVREAVEKIIGSCRDLFAHPAQRNNGT